ncbi:GIY-YIG nuclease family protein [Microbacterium sp. USHLN186]|uniref:GIY-YIG nuclease family protein n=1 Tax=Microbacterium sp. USHLN186 TaxID=3081286 RepID=UPI0030186C2C
MPDHSLTAERILNPLMLHSAADVRNAPASPGIYGWWMKRGALDVPEAPYQEQNGHQLLYVGISPRKPSAAGRASNGNLRKRLVTHATKNASQSTLRRTLGVLLANDLGLTLGVHGGREHYGAQGEALISRWLIENARVAWAVNPQPWEAEDELLEHATLALNLDRRSDAFARSISDRRRAALAATRAAAR